ncbi:MAG: alcohol dehydrogenase catalytic domain-containing protein [Chitinivibrionales bacterium]|nr:alcohol dehydrogenase catalytic domain-containing protein [Chitinivibrionales bacterium]
MKTAVYYSNSDVRVEERPIPEVGDNDILLKVMASGLCGSDLMEWYRIKRAPLVLGHEPAGEIIAVGSKVQKFKIGDRVFTTHHVPCDECFYCKTGHETACTVFQSVNNFDPGGFSQYLRITGRSLHTGTFVLSDDVSWEQGAFIEPLATAVRALRTVELKPAQSVLVCGSGIAGLLFIKLAKALGAGNIIATDMSEYRLKQAKEFGADHTAKATEDIPSFVKEVNDGRSAETVIICAGAVPAAESALQSVDKGGLVLFFAVPKPEETIPVDFNPFWRNDITIKTCYGAAPLDNMQALELIGRRVVTVTDMISHRFGIDQIQEAFSIGAQPDECLKVIIEPNK